MLGTVVYLLVRRPRPYGITIIGDWGGYSTPSPVAVLTVFLMAAYCLVVPGRPRTYAKVAVGVIVAVVAFAGCTWPSTTPPTSSWAVALGVAIPVTAFRFFTPNEVFPVRTGGASGAPGRRPGRAVRRSGRPCATSSG